jgi:hypothetical protein
VRLNIDPVAGFQNDGFPTPIKPQAGTIFEEQQPFVLVLYQQDAVDLPLPALPAGKYK